MKKLFLMTVATMLSLLSYSQCNSSFHVNYGSSGTVNFTNTSTGNNLYYWNLGDENYSSNKNPSHTFGPGTYTTCLTVFNLTDSACTSTYCQIITIAGNDSTITGNDSTIHLQNPCNLNASFSTYPDSIGNSTNHFSANATGGTGNYQYFWNFGDGNAATGQYQNHTFATGTYTVCLDVIDILDSACFTTYCETITIAGNGNDSTNNSIDSTITGNDSTIHSQNPCNLNASFNTYYDTTTYFDANATGGTGNYQYFWNFGDGNTATGQYQNHTFATGTYTVCLDVIDILDSACFTTYCETITIAGNGNDSTNNSIDSTITGNDSTIHSQNPCNLNASFNTYYDTTTYFDANATGGTGNYQYFWNFGDGNTATGQYQNHTFATGTYTVCLDVIDILDSACFTTYCETITIAGNGNDSTNISIDSTITGNDSTITEQENIGKADNFLANDITIYPNPVQNYVNVNFYEDHATVYIYNTFGSLIKTAFINSSNSRISVSNLERGSYLISIKTKTTVYHSKFIKQ